MVTFRVPTEYRQKITPAFIKTFDEERGILKGYPSVGGFPDSYGDIVEPGAFKRTLEEFRNRIRLCWQHDFREPIGKPHVLQEHSRDRLPPELLARYPLATCGLYTETKISDTTQGRDAKVLLRDGVVDEMSIGWDPYPGGEHTAQDGYNHLTDIILYEFSLVTMAAMPAAMVTDFKNANILYRQAVKKRDDLLLRAKARQMARETGLSLTPLSKSRR